MRVLIATDFYYPFINGVTRQVEGLAEALSASGHSVLILAPSDRDTTQHVERSGITIMGVSGIPNIFSKDLRLCLPFFGSMERINGVVRNWHPDIIHVQTNFMLAWTIKQSAMRYRVPLLFTHHNFLYQSRGHWWRPLDLMYQGYLKRLYWGHPVTVPAEVAIQHLRQEYSGTCNYIHLPNGIDEAEFGSRRRSRDQAKQQLALDNRRVLIYVGRLSAEKRVIDAIDGVHLVDDENLRLILIGAGSQERNLRKRVEKRDSDRIIFAGKLQRQELKIYYEASDAVLFPSPVESHSLAQLEALSYGLPVLGVKAGGGGAMIVDGVNGLLFPPRQPAALAEGIERYFASPEAIRTGMEEEAKRSAKPYGFSRLVQRYLGLYGDIIRGREFSY